LFPSHPVSELGSSDALAAPCGARVAITPDRATSRRHQAKYLVVVVLPTLFADDDAIWQPSTRVSLLKFSPK